VDSEQHLLSSDASGTFCVWSTASWVCLQVRYCVLYRYLSLYIDIYLFPYVGYVVSYIYIYRLVKRETECVCVLHQQMYCQESHRNTCVCVHSEEESSQDLVKHPYIYIYIYIYMYRTGGAEIMDTIEDTSPVKRSARCLYLYSWDKKKTHFKSVYRVLHYFLYIFVDFDIVCRGLKPRTDRTARQMIESISHSSRSYHNISYRRFKHKDGCIRMGVSYVRKWCCRQPYKQMRSWSVPANALRSTNMHALGRGKKWSSSNATLHIVSL
jgi:hypothetical protein